MTTTHPAPTSASTTARAPRALRGRLATPARIAGHVAALPLRALARSRPPAVADPSALHPGDPPPTDGKLLLLFDGGCGICLHARDLFAALDWNHRLAYDRIVRHDQGLLAALDPEARYGSWHTVHDDGRLEHGAQGVASALEAIPIGALPAKFIRRFPDISDAAYQWFVRNRSWVSQTTGLINHPQRDPREQLHDPKHAEVAPKPTSS